MCRSRPSASQYLIDPEWRVCARLAHTRRVTRQTESRFYERGVCGPNFDPIDARVFFLTHTAIMIISWGAPHTARHTHNLVVASLKFSPDRSIHTYTPHTEKQRAPRDLDRQERGGGAGARRRTAEGGHPRHAAAQGFRERGGAHARSRQDVDGAVAPSLAGSSTTWYHHGPPAAAHQ
jgi:hypothetical protein